ncbi:AAA family ATPase [Aeromonas sp.]|uniref:ATP-dependent nuclease n=1 Tax=Aeromonas sp. TaxID=647 RepID=UPI00258620CD|nr:AAA family ATPase [Aeromonas sp.]MCX7134972.1 AAA family ATPase [Aeromonas sp.]
MKLKSLSVDNFRALRGKRNKIEFSDSNIIFIFGKNNIGKSSFLHAYKYFTSPSQSASITDFYEQNDKNIITIEAVFIKEAGDDENFKAKGLDKWVSATGEVRFRKTWSTVGQACVKETFDPIENSYVTGGFGGLETILTNATPDIIYIEAMPNVKDLTDWIEKEIKNKLLKKLQENHADEYQEALASIKKLQEKVEGEGYLGTIKDGANKYFNKTFPDLELNICATPYKEADLSKSFEKDFSITIGKKPDENQPDRDEELLAQAIGELETLNSEQQSSNRKFDLHGHGLIRQAIINILGMFRDTKEDRKHVILFEEPELYLHPSNKRKFRDTLYSIAEQDNYQIICVSHDPQLIDLRRQHTSLARLVKLENDETVIYQAGDNVFSKDDETKNKILMLNRFNPHICEVFFSDEVILVEGDTEAIVLRELLEKHYPQKEIFVLNTATKNNIPFFINILSHFKIKQHIIHDSDERYLYDNGKIMLTKEPPQAPRKNSAWTLNKTIWDAMCSANEEQELSSRYVSIRNFEDVHSYKHDSVKGKPFSAYEYATKIDFSDDAISIVKQLKQIVGDLEVEYRFTPDELEGLVKEPH